MKLADQIASIEAGLDRVGIKKSKLFEVAGISFVTWSRWKGGKNKPLESKWQSVMDAYKSLTRNH